MQTFYHTVQWAKKKTNRYNKPVNKIRDLLVDDFLFYYQLASGTESTTELNEKRIGFYRVL